MKTHAILSLYGAKVIRSPRDKDVVVIKKTQNGDEYATFLVADVESGGVYRIVCFDSIAKQAMNMGLVTNEDTVFVNGKLDLIPVKNSEGKTTTQYVRVKATTLAYGPKLTENKNKKAEEVETLSAADVFRSGIPSGEPFR